ncbi:hypothetical protein L1049_009373 [Liquidambar formosana]|uniref:Uncharacterized protein n=1 Tax=Liquidambar formosana TaxID=63359 RepID=A0AAP0SB60_LIQFO
MGRLRMEVEDGYELFEEGCMTPKNQECQIPAALECPPAPVKKRVSEKKRDPPKKGYFQPPELESIFAMTSGRKAWA